ATCAGPPPVQREPQKVEGGRTFPPGLPLLLRLEKGQQAGLVRVEGQPIALQPLTQHFPNPLRVLAPFEADDKVIRIADQTSTPTQARLDLPLEPAVEYVMQVEVAQERRR